MAGMSTVFDETRVRRGATTPASNRGSFREHQHSEPDLALSYPQLTPAEVRTAEFSRDALVAALGTAILKFYDVGDGSAVYRYQTVVGSGTVMGYSVQIDELGDVLEVGELYDVAAGGGHWQTYPANSGISQLLQDHIDRARLRAAGIDTGGHPDNDGGHYGYRHVGAKSKEDGLWDATEVSKRVRADIKAAIAFGALPEEATYSVRTSKYSGGQSVRVVVSGIDPELLTEPPTEDDGYPFPRQHPYAQRLVRNVELIGAQYNDYERDSTTDYDRSRFHFHVDFA